MTRVLAASALLAVAGQPQRTDVRLANTQRKPQRMADPHAQTWRKRHQARSQRPAAAAASALDAHREWRLLAAEASCTFCAQRVRGRLGVAFREWRLVGARAHAAAAHHRMVRLPKGWGALRSAASRRSAEAHDRALALEIAKREGLWRGWARWASEAASAVGRRRRLHLFRSSTSQREMALALLQWLANVRDTGSARAALSICESRLFKLALGEAIDRWRLSTREWRERHRTLFKAAVKLLTLRLSQALHLWVAVWAARAAATRESERRRRLEWAWLSWGAHAQADAHATALCRRAALLASAAASREALRRLRVETNGFSSRRDASTRAAAAHRFSAHCFRDARARVRALACARAACAPCS